MAAGTSNPSSAVVAPGGVGRNVAENLARWGVAVSLLGVVGEDALSTFVLEETAGAGSAIQAGSDYLNKLLSRDYDPTAGREYWEESFKKPMMQQWKQEIMPSIAEKYAGSGAISSSGFNRTMGTAATNMETQLGSQLSDILYQGSEAHKGRQIQGAGLSQQLANLLSETGGEQRNIGLQQWEAQQPWGNPWLNYLNLALNSKAFENSAQAPYQSPSPLGMAFNTLGSLGSMYAYKNF